MVIRRALSFSSDRTYWLCQILGWLCMVVIEVMNYSFFIVKKFSAEVLFFFLMYAVEGVIITELYRRIFIKRDIFHSPLSYVWFYAFVSTLIISLLMTFVTNISVIVAGPIDWNDWGIIAIVGSTVNWMRYIGVWIIIYFMHKVLRRNSTIQSEKLIAENRAKTTELELLKMQLNPHFLFNALNSIKALVIINPEQSREAIVKLSELLRFTLRYGRERFIPFHCEFAEVVKYVELEQMRFGARLQVCYDIADLARHWPIPPALMLTLVENAVKHGIAKQIEPGYMTITVNIEGDWLLMQITNPGCYAPTADQGIGLQHMMKRLEEVYNGQASFKIVQQENNVLATLRIPQAQ